MADVSRIPNDQYPLRGRALRFVLVEELRQHPTMTVAEMVEYLAGHGFNLAGRASKLISDALRWEVLRGRVIRLRRGVYAYGKAPRTTARRIRLFARQCVAWINAAAQGEEPPPTPPTPEHRKTFTVYDDHPLRLPWLDLTWLWTT